MSESKGLTWIRKSKGDNDDIGLKQQREVVTERAKEVADDYEELDLGVHTGFSQHSFPERDDLLDENPKVLNYMERIREGEFDYIFAYDDRRVCRDEFYHVIKHAMIEGGAEFVFEDDIPDDELVRGVKRIVDKHSKIGEMRKSRKALELREEKGYDEGRPPKGLTYDDEGKYWIPDEDSDEFERVLKAIQMRENDVSYSDVKEETGLTKTTVWRIMKERKEEYLSIAEEHGISVEV